jgi:Uma2 family endonuclease
MLLGSIGMRTMNAQAKKTYSDYFRETPEGAQYQLINGEIVRWATPDIFHQTVSGRILSALSSVINRDKLGIVLCIPTDVYLSEYDTFQPEVLFVSANNKWRCTERFIEGAPDLVVEVLSSSTGYYDLTLKKSRYEESGVKEYWIVDPKLKSIKVLTNERTNFVTHAKAKNSGTVASKLLAGFRIELNSIFERK